MNDLQQRVLAESQAGEAADESTTVVSKSEQLKVRLMVFHISVRSAAVHISKYNKSMGYIK